MFNIFILLHKYTKATLLFTAYLYAYICKFVYFLSLRGDCSSQNLTDVAVSNTTKSELCSLGVKQRTGIYGGLLVSLVIVNTARVIAFFVVCISGSRVLHNRMLASVLRAPVRFFDTNPVGRVLNRFSNDTGSLDNLLPFIFCEYMLVSIVILCVCV